jgi:hypothetical protein
MQHLKNTETKRKQQQEQKKVLVPAMRKVKVTNL